MKLKAPECVFSSAGFCPGCGHGLASRLVGEVAEELGIVEKLVTVVDVACCSFNIDYWNFDTIMAAHGRDIPTAAGTAAATAAPAQNTGLLYQEACSPWEIDAESTVSVYSISWGTLMAVVSPMTVTGSSAGLPSRYPEPHAAWTMPAGDPGRCPPLRYGGLQTKFPDLKPY